jgi:signal transduction histidine kinase/ActR/RegA family two-component response regulator
VTGRAYRPDRQLAIASAINKDILRALSERDLLEAACRVVVEHGRLRFAWVGLLRDGALRVGTAAWWGSDVGALERIRLDVDRSELEPGPTEATLRAGVHAVCNDLSDAQGKAPWGAAALERGYRSAAAFPLRRGERVVGALTVYADTADHFDDEEVGWLTSLCDDVSHALASFAHDRRRRALEARLRRREARARAELRVADRMTSIGRVAMSVAHEVNNPLAYVALNLELITRGLWAAGDGVPGPLRGRLLHAATEADRGVERVRRIVRALGAFGRGDEDRVGAVDVHQALDVALNLADPHLRWRARIARSYEATRPAQANAFRLEQVFLNLLVNAADAIGDGAPEQNEIRVATSDRDDDRVVVEVSDTGPGVPHAKRSRIFEPFFTTKPVGKGTGLGLSVCRSIVTSLGGEISVHDAERRGSTFRVVLPAAPPEEPATHRSPGATPRAAGVEDGPGPTILAPSGERARVLVVEDEAALGALLADILGDHEVVAVCSAREALELCASESFDCILCDLLMPGMTGMDLHEALRRQGRWVERRMIFMTGGASTARALQFIDSVPNPVLAKPFDITALRAAVDAAVRGKVADGG